MYGPRRRNRRTAHRDHGGFPEQDLGARRRRPNPFERERASGCPSCTEGVIAANSYMATAWVGKPVTTREGSRKALWPVWLQEVNLRAIQDFERGQLPH